MLGIVEKMAIFVRNSYAYISVRRYSSNGCGNNKFINVIFSEFMILSGGGDLHITLKILFYCTDKIESVNCDHPYECGFSIFEK